MNPFIDVGEFPDFGAMTPVAAKEAFPILLAQTKSKIEELEKNAEPEWDSLVEGLHDATHPLWRAWGYLSHLLSVSNSDEWRKVQDEYREEIVNLSLRIGQSAKFYALLKEIPASTPCRRRILDDMLRSAEHSGVALEGEEKEEFNAIQAKSAKLRNDFHNNVLDATKAFSETVTDESRLAGLPEQIKSTMKTGDGWRLSIEDAVYVPFMKHCEDRELREKLYRARSTRASSGKTDNTAIIDELLALRKRLANLLGYKTYAELSISEKSAPSVEAVEKMTADLADAAKDIAKEENESLYAFKKEVSGDDGKLMPWDVAYWAEKMREANYAYSEEELSKYFDFKCVLDGMFGTAKRLFGIDIEECTGIGSTWHKDVRIYRVKDETGEAIAYFYFDPYSRPETKSGGAWMNDFASRERRKDGSVAKPIAVMCCNQTPPGENGQALMRHSEVETLFHEFGHALQHMLTKVDDRGASGINLVEWDAVEIASQFMENWCTDIATLKTFAKHVETGEEIPLSLVDKVRNARNYRAANACMRQLSFGAIDMLLHGEDLGGRTPNEAKEEVFEKYTPGTSVPEDRFLNAFSHIFAGGYAAGYYGYKWSEVMSADIFGAFEEAGLDDNDAVAALGRRCRDTLLALGGSVPPMEVFEMFRGRAPQVDALLRQSGLKGKGN
jgi:oligopeptidase A